MHQYPKGNLDLGSGLQQRRNSGNLHRTPIQMPLLLTVGRLWLRKALEQARGRGSVVDGQRVKLHPLDLGLAEGAQHTFVHLRVSLEEVLDVAPPGLAVCSVPLDGQAEALVESGLLLPSKTLELGAVDGVASIVKGSIADMLHALVQVGFGFRRSTKDGEEVSAELRVGDFVGGRDVVDLADGAFVQNGVEGIGSVTGI